MPSFWNGLRRKKRLFQDRRTWKKNHHFGELTMARHRTYFRCFKFCLPKSLYYLSDWPSLHVRVLLLLCHQILHLLSYVPHSGSFTTTVSSKITSVWKLVILYSLLSRLGICSMFFLLTLSPWVNFLPMSWFILIRNALKITASQRRKLECNDAAFH